jgi:hypothetical protein
MEQRHKDFKIMALKHVIFKDNKEKNQTKKRKIMSTVTF